MSLELFVRGLYTRTAVAHHHCFSWAFLSLSVKHIQFQLMLLLHRHDTQINAQ